MPIKIKSLLFKTDFIGFIPQLRILEERRYKSLFSSILSIIIIIFSVAFIFYSFVDYLNQNPNVLFYKNNDLITNKTYTISNSLLMFQKSFSCISNNSLDEPNLTISARDSTQTFFQDIDYEPCELGKNLDMKYKDIVEEFERNENEKISEYSCLNFNGKDFTLFGSLNLDSELERHLQFELYSSCESYILFFDLITQNDFIEHRNRMNPLVPYYQRQILTLHRPSNLVINYNYIKYETDDGYIFSNKKEINGIGISNTNSYDKIDFYDDILLINFKMNGASYDYYQRSFIKFQAFLADVMSLINLLITISKIISEFLLNKKMDKDIIRYILTSNNINKNNISKEKQIHEIFDNNYDKNQKRIIDTQKSVDSSNEISSKIDLESENKNEKINNIMKNLKINSIIKSFFCCEDKKTKIINLCEDIVEKDICIERILKRLYLIENEFDILKNKNFFEIQNIIDNISKESNEKNNNKIEKISKKNKEVIK